jgi:hypothetical protein
MMLTQRFNSVKGRVIYYTLYGIKAEAQLPIKQYLLQPVDLVLPVYAITRFIDPCRLKDPDLVIVSCPTSPFRR